MKTSVEVVSSKPWLSFEAVVPFEAVVFLRSRGALRSTMAPARAE